MCLADTKERYKVCKSGLTVVNKFAKDSSFTKQAREGSKVVLKDLKNSKIGRIDKTTTLVAELKVEG